MILRPGSSREGRPQHGQWEGPGAPTRKTHHRAGAARPRVMRKLAQARERLATSARAPRRARPPPGRTGPNSGVRRRHRRRPRLPLRHLSAPRMLRRRALVRTRGVQMPRQHAAEHALLPMGQDGLPRRVVRKTRRCPSGKEPLRGPIPGPQVPLGTMFHVKQRRRMPQPPSAVGDLGVRPAVGAVTWCRPCEAPRQ